MKIKVGTRGSKLALTQSQQLLDLLSEKNPEVSFEIVIIKTKGDLIQDVPLHKMNDKGIFVKEIEEALLKGEIDLAVHSMKDMPSISPEGLKFSCVPKREDPRDVFIFAEGIECLEQVPRGGKIGTGSKRRAFQLKKLRPDIETVPIRGNVDTRIRKIQEDKLDGIILAAAGMKRLHLEEKISQYIKVEEMVPAPTQGILALQIREDDRQMEKLLKTIEDPESTLQMKAERAYMKALGGSCHVPIGGYCKVMGELALIYGVFGDENGERLVSGQIETRLDKVEESANVLAGNLLKELKK